MKKYLLIVVCFLFAIACKKNETPQPDRYLSSIKFNNGTSLVVIYNLFYSADKKLERVTFRDVSGGTTINVLYSLKYEAGKLDSIIKYDSISSTRTGVNAEWTGDKMTFFWTSTYTYNTQDRITNISTISGNVFRTEYLNDSTLNYLDPTGTDPEYLSWVTYRTADVKNPFRIKGNENLFPINNYIFNFINEVSTKEGGFDLAESKSTLYNTDGSIYYISTNTYDGNLSSYPTKQTITYSRSSEVRTLEFTYRE